MLSKIVLVASALAASVSAQGVTAKISPTAPAPAGCTGTSAQPFNIAVVNATSASMKNKRQSTNADVLAITLNNGVLLDSKGRTGYIAANRQFQFDGPAQTGAIYTAGFSVCGNGTLALGGSALWWECLSGEFYNLYDESQGPQCIQIFIDALPVTASSSSAVVSQQSDGQVTATSASAVSQITDGQIQATTPASALASSSTMVVSQITDGQIQATTPASALASSSTPMVVSQITDGQIQATTPASSLSPVVTPVSQIPDGQIQATRPANSTVARPTTVAPYLGNGAAVMTAAPAAAALGLAALFML